MEVIEMSTKAPQEKPIGAVKPPAPAAPPTTEYVGKSDYDLHPLMKSERRQLQDKIREAEQRFDLAYSQACSKFTSIINTDESLTLEQKINILEKLWK
jgi:hypothetical protein